MRIHITFGLEKIELDVNLQTSIKQLKDLIFEKTQIPPKYQVIKFREGSDLENERSLADYNIQIEDTLSLGVGGFHIFVKNLLTGKTSFLNVDFDNNTVADIKTKIRTMEGMLLVA
jgi:hypothetical protein